MNILVLGGGGREHALAWAIKQNPKCDRLIVAPGNAGIAGLAETADIDITNPGVVANFTSGAGAWNRFDLRGNGQTLAGINTGNATTLGGGVIQNRELGNITPNSTRPVRIFYWAFFGILF
jgi:hypothetical protein